VHSAARALRMIMHDEFLVGDRVVLLDSAVAVL
jgi:hypothetical protein